MHRRSRGREVALQLLFQRDLNDAVDTDDVERFVQERLMDDTQRTFTRQLYQGVVANQRDLDRRIAACAENWRLPRMPVVDRNVLRLGAFELLHCQDATPAAVAFDEAIELGRRFGTADSPSFINGVLDRLKREADPASPPRTAGKPDAFALPS